MKIRNGFVSNSSSSSFIINIDKFEENRSKFELEYNKRKEEYLCKNDRWRDISKEEKAKEFDDGYQLFLTNVYNRTDFPILEIEDIIENHLMSYTFRIGNDEKSPYKVDEKYDLYNLNITEEFKIRHAMQTFYILKPVLDDKNGRLNLLQALKLAKDYHLSLYENNTGPDSAKPYIDYINRIDNEKRNRYNSKLADKRWLKHEVININKLMKLSSKKFFEYLLERYFLDKWYMDYEKVYNKTKSVILKKAITSIVNDANRFMYNKIKDFYEKNKGQRFIEVEYSDGGGCGTTNLFLHNGNIVNEFKTLYISNH